MNRLCCLIAAALLAVGCTDRGIVQPAADASLQWNAAAGPGGPGLTVMTYNVYYGTDPSPLLAVQNPADVPVIAAPIWAMVHETNFPARAGALAKLIAKRRPHLVGLQEAALYRVQSPGDAAFGGSIPATVVAYDFIALLVDSLAARGLHYVVAAADSTTDIEVPVLTGVDPATGVPSFDDVRLTDRDAVLARADVPFTEPQHGKYAAFIPVLGSGVYEGWSSVLATVDHRTYRFISTHLEFQQALPVQLAQVHELLGLLANETRPTILVGDFNSDVYGKVPGKATPSYDSVTHAGFTDSWIRPHDHDPGLTCCQQDDVANPSSTLDSRLDFVFTRNLPRRGNEQMRVVDRDVVGDELRDRTRSGLWPSDHGGVVVTLLPPGPRRHDDVAYGKHVESKGRDRRHSNE